MKNKTYNKKPTRHQRIKKAHQQLYLLGIIVAMTAVLTITQAYHLITLARALPTPAPKQDTMKSSTTPVINQTNKEYVWTYLEQTTLTLDERLMFMEVINCESRFDQWAINKNSDKYGSYDTGIVQFNNYWHKEVSRECAFNIDCAVENMIRVYKADGNLNQWVCYK